MRRYLFKRLFLLAPFLLGVTLLTFALTKALLGDPVLSMVGERAQPEVIERIRKEIGLDKDALSQYLVYIELLLKGEFERSYYNTNRKVFDDLLLKLPNTIPVGLSLGFISASKITDRIISSVSVIGLNLPVFWSRLLIMLFFSLKLKLFPPSGTRDIRFLTLPSITLALPAIATLTRVTRTTLIEIFNMSFVTTARAKGIKEFRINSIHVFKNALIPLITVIGLDQRQYSDRMA